MPLTQSSLHAGERAVGAWSGVIPIHHSLRLRSLPGRLRCLLPLCFGLRNHPPPPLSSDEQTTWVHSSRRVHSKGLNRLWNGTLTVGSHPPKPSTFRLYTSSCRRVPNHPMSRTVPMMQMTELGHGFLGIIKVLGGYRSQCAETVRVTIILGFGNG